MMSEVRETPGAANVVRLADRRSAARAARAAGRASVDENGVSEQARELAAALDAVREAPDTRCAKAAVLKACLVNGRYHPDPRARV